MMNEKVCVLVVITQSGRKSDFVVAISYIIMIIGWPPEKDLFKNES